MNRGGSYAVAFIARSSSIPSTDEQSKNILIRDNIYAVIISLLQCCNLGEEYCLCWGLALWGKIIKERAKTRCGKYSEEKLRFVQNLHKHWQLQFGKVNAFTEKFETRFGQCRECMTIMSAFHPFQIHQLMHAYSFKERRWGHRRILTLVSGQGRSITYNWVLLPLFLERFN